MVYIYGYIIYDDIFIDIDQYLTNEIKVLLIFADFI